MNDEPAPAVVQVPGSPSENSSTSDDDDDDKKRKGTAPSRERITMKQKLKAIQHFEKNRMTQKELGDLMYKSFMLKKKFSKSAVANNVSAEGFGINSTCWWSNSVSMVRTGRRIQHAQRLRCAL